MASFGFLTTIDNLVTKVAFISAAILLGFWLLQKLPTSTSPLSGIPRAHQSWRLPGTPQYWNEPTPDVLWQWQKTALADRGLLGYVGVGNQRRILVTDRQAVREILSSRNYRDFKRPDNVRKRLVTLTGNGLIASEGETHKAQRRMLGPSFSPKAIRELWPLFWSKAFELSTSMLEQYEMSVQGREWQCLELRSGVSRCALDIIGVAVWGRDTEAIRNPQSEFVRTYEARLEANTEMVFVKALGLLFPMSLVQRLPLRSAQILRAGTHQVRAYCAKALHQRKGDEDVKEDIVSKLLGSKVLEDEQSLIDHMLTMLLAGHDTSTVSITWACYFLCKNPAIQEQLRQEIRCRLPSPKTTGSTYDPASTRLPLLEAVLNETWRLMPPVSMIRREAIQDTELLGHRFAAGTHIVICPYVLNRAPEIWGADAENFNPERWMESDIGSRLHELTTFGYGPRSCIGQPFARGETNALLAALIGRFEMELDGSVPDPRPLWGLTVAPENGLRVRLRSDGDW